MVECPNCNSENAHHNGVCYECSECDYEWGDGYNLFDDDDDE